MSMKFVVMRPGEITEYLVEWIEIATDQGSFVIQPEHAPAIFTLSSHQACVFGLSTGVEESILVSQGVIEVGRTSVLLLISDLL